MKRSMHNRILVLILAMLTLIVPPGSISAEQESNPVSADEVLAQTNGTVEATEEPGTSGVTDLPETGRGYGIEPEESGTVALQQMATTAFVLLVAAATALGGLALLWCYERR